MAELFPARDDEGSLLETTSGPDVFAPVGQSCCDHLGRAGVLVAKDEIKTKALSYELL